MSHSDMLPAVETFVARVREVMASGLREHALWDSVREHMQVMLRSEQLLAHAGTWPTSPAELGLEGKHANLLFYEDPDYGFVINGLIKAPHAKTTVHDHGKSWTLYGVVQGSESVLRFERTDPGQQGDLPARATVAATSDAKVEPGYIDLIQPWEIHAEFNGPQPTVAVIVRSQRCGSYVQNIFYRETGQVEQYWGPKQIPFKLG